MSCGRTIQARVNSQNSEEETSSRTLCAWQPGPHFGHAYTRPAGFIAQKRENFRQAQDGHRSAVLLIFIAAISASATRG
jgi:hypothetical protein